MVPFQWFLRSPSVEVNIVNIGTSWRAVLSDMMSWTSGGPKVELSGGVFTALSAGNKEMNCISKEFKSSKTD